MTISVLTTPNVIDQFPVLGLVESEFVTVRAFCRIRLAGLLLRVVQRPQQANFWLLQGARMEFALKFVAVIRGRRQLAAIHGRHLLESLLISQLVRSVTSVVSHQHVVVLLLARSRLRNLARLSFRFLLTVSVLVVVSTFIIVV